MLKLSFIKVKSLAFSKPPKKVVVSKTHVLIIDSLSTKRKSRTERNPVISKRGTTQKVMTFHRNSYC